MRKPDHQARPPKIARALLSGFLRYKRREEYEAALEELFRKRVHRDGPSRANVWYWRQLLGFAIRWRSFKPKLTSDVNSRESGVARGRESTPIEGVMQDVRLSVRRLRREPTFAIAVALTLSLGIGASTAVFGVASTTLLSRMPYDASDRLVVGRTVYSTAPSGFFNGVSALNYFDYRESSRSFESLAAFWDGSPRMIVTGSDAAFEAQTGYATWNLFRTLRVDPVIGRHFLQEEEVQADARLAIVSFGLWQNRLGGTRDVVGRTLTLDGSPHTIVGVLPRSCRFLWDADIWRLAVRPGETRHINAFYLLGRLKPGVTMPQAQLDVDAISRVLEQEYPDTNRDSSLRLTSLQLFLGGGVRSALLLPAAAAACLLLIACANVATLLLARGQRRMAEIAVRSALGASRWRLVRQLLIESVTLTLPAGLLGVGIGYLLQQVLLHLVPVGLLGVRQPVVDGAVLLFVLVTSVGTGLLVGFVPAVGNSAVVPSPHVGTGRQACERRSSTRLRAGLVALQISISIVLLVGTGLVARSLFLLSAVDLGFSSEQVIAARIVAPLSRTGERASTQAFFASVLEEIRALPGVQSAGAVSRLPIRHPGGTWRTRAADRPLASGDPGELAHLRSASPGYFAAMNMPLQMGRDFLEADRGGAPAVAVLSESLARGLYPDRDPVGRSVIILDDINHTEVPYEVVGVVRDAHLSSPRVSGDPAMYVSVLQASPTRLWTVVRTDGDAAALAGPIRQIVRQHDPDALVTSVASMDDIIDQSFSGIRRVARYLGLFAGVAVLLAAIGLYGALVYHVSQQEREIGVRLAVGATRAGIIGLVLRQGAGIVAVGLLFGMAGAYPSTILVRDLLFETVPLDLATYLIAVWVLGLVATAACLVPAMRATRVDPAIMLRRE